MTAAKNVGMWHPLVMHCDAWTSTKPTSGASARLVDLHSICVRNFVLFCLFLLFLFVSSCNMAESGILLILIYRSCSWFISFWGS